MVMSEARQAGAFLDERDMLGWADQISDALLFMHSQDPPIFHRDIKPSNLKLTPTGLIKLVDFGLVKVQASEEQTITILQGRGTALYTPLEQYGGDTGHTDARSDIYAFGATLYHLATNHPPVEARERFLHPDHLVLPRQLNPNLSYRTERAILWALSLHPDERPKDMAALRKALFGTLEPGTQPRRPAVMPSLADLVSSSPENILLALTAGLLILSLLFTLFR
jgi:serine/threonine-protein kinase